MPSEISSGDISCGRPVHGSSCGLSCHTCLVSKHFPSVNLNSSLSGLPACLITYITIVENDKDWNYAHF